MFVLLLLFMEYLLKGVWTERTLPEVTVINSI